MACVAAIALIGSLAACASPNQSKEINIYPERGYAIFVTANEEGVLSCSPEVAAVPTVRSPNGDTARISLNGDMVVGTTYDKTTVRVDFEGTAHDYNPLSGFVTGKNGQLPFSVPEGFQTGTLVFDASTDWSGIAPVTDVTLCFSGGM